MPCKQFPDDLMGFPGSMVIGSLDSEYTCLLVIRNYTWMLTINVHRLESSFTHQFLSFFFFLHQFIFQISRTQLMGKWLTLSHDDPRQEMLLEGPCKQPSRSPRCPSAHHSGPITAHLCKPEPLAFPLSASQHIQSYPEVLEIPPYNDFFIYSLISGPKALPTVQASLFFIWTQVSVP